MIIQVIWGKQDIQSITVHIVKYSDGVVSWETQYGIDFFATLDIDILAYAVATHLESIWGVYGFKTGLRRLLNYHYDLYNEKYSFYRIYFTGGAKRVNYNRIEKYTLPPLHRM